MAYAFDKVDDYFRRQKTGERGSLNKGTMGAPPPTAAADSLSKQAETSAEIGASDTGQFRANKGASQAATQQALVQPAQKQATQWADTQEKRAQDFQKEGEQRIAQTYQAYSPADIAKVEAGDQAAMNKAMQQRQYTGKEMTFQPYQVEAPQLDTTSMLKGGVGGIQAALQKQKGGRYTGGMAALDASLLAGNREAMQGTQQQLGGIYEGARTKQAALEQTDENLAKKAGETATGISGQVKGALESRGGELRKALEARAKEEFAKRTSGLYDTDWGAYQAQQPLYNENFGIGVGSDVMDVQRLMTPRPVGGGSEDVAMQAYAPVQQRNVSYTQEMSPEYINIMNALGVTPEAMQTMTKSGYGFDTQKVMNAGRTAGQQMRQQYNQLLQGGTQAGVLGYDTSKGMFIVNTPSGEQLLVTRGLRDGIVYDVERYTGGL